MCESMEKLRSQQPAIEADEWYSRVQGLLPEYMYLHDPGMLHVNSAESWGEFSTEPNLIDCRRRWAYRRGAKGA